MTGSTSYHAPIDPERADDWETIKRVFETRYGTAEVEFYGDEFGLHFGIYSKSTRHVPCGLLEEVQASGWKIIYAGQWCHANGEKRAAIEIREVDE